MANTLPQLWLSILNITPEYPFIFSVQKTPMVFVFVFKKSENMETYKIKSERSPLYIQKVMFILGGCDIFLQDFARFVILLCSCFALCVYPFEYEL